jgi:hypothetical protein
MWAKQRICLSINFTGEADTAGSGMTLADVPE